MSYDRKIDQVCEHIVREEALFVTNDLQTVRPLRPIASSKSVKVRLNGEIMVPSSGVIKHAQTKGTKIGPYNIGPQASGTLQTDRGSHSLYLPRAKGMSLDEVCYRLNQQTEYIYFQKSKENTLEVLTDSSTLQVIPSELSKIFGLTEHRIWHKQQLFPGWSLVSDPKTLADRPTRLVVFDAPLKAALNYVEIDYATIQQECRRCGGIGYEHDWRYASNGEVVTVQNEDLLLQETMKIIFTKKGSNPFLAWYGTLLTDLIGRKNTAGLSIQTTLVTEIQTAFRYWQSVKQKQETEVKQEVTDQEFPYRLLSVDAQTDPSDPTVVYVEVVVQNRSGSPISVVRGVPLDTELGKISQSKYGYVGIG